MGSCMGAFARIHAALACCWPFAALGGTVVGCGHLPVRRRYPPLLPPIPAPQFSNYLLLHVTFAFPLSVCILCFNLYWFLSLFHLLIPFISWPSTTPPIRLVLLASAIYGMAWLALACVAPYQQATTYTCHHTEGPHWLYGTAGDVRERFGDDARTTWPLTCYSWTRPPPAFGRLDDGRCISLLPTGVPRTTGIAALLFGAWREELCTFILLSAHPSLRTAPGCDSW